MNRYKFENNNKSHLHLLDGRPLTGVSSVGAVISKPLHWWALQVGLRTLGYLPAKRRVAGKYEVIPQAERLHEAEVALNSLSGLTPEQYLEALDNAYYAHDRVKNEAAGKGTDRHELVEGFVRDCMAEGGITKNVHPEEIWPFVSWAFKDVKRFLWSEAHCYSEKWWLGGISDVGAELNDGGIAVIDIKSSKEAYPNQFWQCAGYDILISENGGHSATGELLFELEGAKIDRHIVFPFGAKNPIAEVRFDVEQNKSAFLSCLNIYRMLNNYE